MRRIVNCQLLQTVTTVHFSHPIYSSNCTLQLWEPTSNNRWQCIVVLKSMCNKWQQNWHSKSLNKTERFKLPDLLQASDVAHVVTNVATQAAACAGCYHPLFWVETGLFWPMREQDGEHPPIRGQSAADIPVLSLYPIFTHISAIQPNLFSKQTGGDTEHWGKTSVKNQKKIQEFLLKLQY